MKADKLSAGLYLLRNITWGEIVKVILVLLQSVAELQWLNTKYERELADAQKERECLKQVTHKKDMSETSVTKLYNQVSQFDLNYLTSLTRV